MTNKIKRISVIGLGYIGLPTAAMMASRGYDVIGVDVNQATVATINKGEVHIVEPDLDIVVRAAVTTGNLRATTEVEPSDVFLVAVPTPLTKDNAPDLSYVNAAVESLAPVLEKGNLIILESTSPVGTTEHIAQIVAKMRPDLSIPSSANANPDVYIAHCPERVLPGYVLQELVNNDRVVGGLSRSCAKEAADFYRLFVRGECFETKASTAEMCKLVENAYRDVNIAYANEISMLCDKLDVNVWDLIALANRHPRVNILQPGPGVGGHCIAVDPWFLVSSSPDVARIIRTAREVNDHKPVYVIEKVKAKADRFKSPTIVCLGLAFKANIDDLRESPALDIVAALAREKVGKIIAVEPNIRALPDSLVQFDNLEFADTATALEQADIVLALVDHLEFKDIDSTTLNDKIVIDTRGMWK